MLEQAPSPVDDNAALQLALAVADGTPVDWEAASGAFSEGSSSASLGPALQQVERILEGHRVLYARLPGHDDSSAETLLSEARRAAEPGTHDDLQVNCGPLVVRDKIGRGSFGDVYRAWDPKLEREVALKLVPATTSTAGFSGAFEEGRRLARVRHPNVVTVHGVEQADGRVGIWMELIDAPTVAEEVATGGAMPPAEAARIGRAVADALLAVHAAGLLHRDVKAQNVMRDRDGRIVLGDFGTGRELNAPSSDGELAGTPLYLAPEVLAGQPATTESDQYSVGVLLYYLVTGDHPARGRTLAAVRDAHTRGERVPLAERFPDLPRRFTEIVERATAPDPAKRFDSVPDLGYALSSLVDSADTGIPAPDVRPRARRSTRWWIATSLVAGVIVAAGVLPQLGVGARIETGTPRSQPPVR